MPDSITNTQITAIHVRQSSRNGMDHPNSGTKELVAQPRESSRNAGTNSQLAQLQFRQRRDLQPPAVSQIPQNAEKNAQLVQLAYGMTVKIDAANKNKFLWKMGEYTLDCNPTFMSDGRIVYETVLKKGDEIIPIQEEVFIAPADPTVNRLLCQEKLIRAVGLAIGVHPTDVEVRRMQFGQAVRQMNMEKRMIGDSDTITLKFAFGKVEYSYRAYYGFDKSLGYTSDVSISEAIIQNGKIVRLGRFLNNWPRRPSTSQSSLSDSDRVQSHKIEFVRESASRHMGFSFTDTEIDQMLRF